MTPIFELSDLDDTSGFRFTGPDVQFQLFSLSVSGAGDVNQDGFDDIVVGAPGFDSGQGFRSGETYVVFGQASASAVALDNASLDGSNGFRLPGVAVEDRNGRTVSNAGDINGDGFDDIVFGSQSGGYVVFGKAMGFAASIDVTALDGTDGFVFDENITAVSGAGDLNGDGFDDLILTSGNLNSGGSGTGYVVFGKESGYSAVFDPVTLDGTNGFQLDGIAVPFSVSDAGDVNGDGFDEIIIGDPSEDTNGFRAGESYVVFGAAGGFAPTFDVATLNGANGFRITNPTFAVSSGASVSSAGDINGDGFDDLIVGVPGLSSSYVVFGKASGFAASVDFSTLNGPTGFRILGDNVGFSVSNAGDFNGDGFDDLVLGTRDSNGDGARAYVLFGKPSAFSATVDLTTLNFADGFQIDSDPLTGESFGSVSAAGDVNGDGFDDIILAATSDSTNGTNDVREAVVVYGFANTDITQTGTPAADSLIGGLGNDTLEGLGEDDTLEGRDGDDILNGGADADTIFGGRGNDRIDGGTGIDTMDGGSGSDIYFVDNAADTVIEAVSADTDIVYTTVSYTAPQGVERVIAAASAGNISLTARNFQSDILIGNAASNVFIDQWGRDTYIGGGGADFFRFTANLGPVNNLNRINDFNPVDDQIQLSRYVFTELKSGILDADLFVNGTAAQDADDRIIYDSASGTLSYDPDGTGTMAQTAFAILAGAPAVTHEDIQVFGPPEIVTGTANAETLTGSTLGETILGLGGDDTLIGLAGKDTLDGGTGADRMEGGAGNDIYQVDNAADTVIEGVLADTDIVFTTVSYTAPQGVERVIGVEGAGNIALTGRNFQSDILIGNSASNVFVDQSGRDTFIGGGGADFFRFIANLDRVNNANRINDFNSTDDQIQLQQTIYSEISLGILDASRFVTGIQAADADDRIIYDSASGTLFYDRDGTGAAAQVEFVNVTAGTAITADDFQIF